MFCGRHQRAYRTLCVACRAERALQAALEAARSKYEAALRELDCPKAPAGAAWPYRGHTWQGVLDRPGLWECTRCGKAVQDLRPVIDPGASK